MGRHKKPSKELTTELLYLELSTVSVSCGVKRYMHYIRFLLTNTSKAKKFESIFPLGSIFFYIIDFFINLQMETEQAFAFLNTAVIIFSLRYSLNIPHQTPSFFLCKTQYPSFQNSDFGDILQHRHRKIILTFFFRVILPLSRQT